MTLVKRGFSGIILIGLIALGALLFLPKPEMTPINPPANKVEPVRFDPGGGSFEAVGNGVTLNITYNIADGFCKINGDMTMGGESYSFDELKQPGDKCNPIFMVEFIQKAIESLSGKFDTETLRKIIRVFDLANEWIAPFVK